MSQEERDELDWWKRVKAGSISQREAARKMGVSDRWVRTLLKRMSKQGDAVVVHGLRGRPSNRKLATETCVLRGACSAKWSLPCAWIYSISPKAPRS